MQRIVDVRASRCSRPCNKGGQSPLRLFNINSFTILSPDALDIPKTMPKLCPPYRKNPNITQHLPTSRDTGKANNIS
jgi:hypothetical protein